jgi:hypothetical protein
MDRVVPLLGGQSLHFPRWTDGCRMIGCDKTPPLAGLPVFRLRAPLMMEIIYSSQNLRPQVRFFFGCEIETTNLCVGCERLYLCVKENGKIWHKK